MNEGDTGPRIRHEEEQIVVPRAALLGGGALMAVTLLLSWVAVSTGVGRFATEDAPSVAAMDIRFVQDDQGSVTVEEADSGRLLQQLKADQGGFVRGILRPLERERERAGRPLHERYRLELQQSGALVLRDPEGSLRVDVRAFGATAHAQFEALLAGVSQGP